MRDSTQMRAAVTEYARNYIRERHRVGMTYAAIAEELECSTAYVQQLNDVEGYAGKRVGIEVENALARIVHGGSIDALRKAALHVYGGGRVIADIKGEPVDLGRGRPIGTPSSIPPQLPGSTDSSAAGNRSRGRRAR